MDPKIIREQTIRDAKCSLILDAARAVFAEKGFYDSRLEDIGAAAGFSKASLYNYYPDKETIFLNLAIREYEDMLLHIREQLGIEMKLKEKLTSILREIFTHFGREFNLMLATDNFQTLSQFHLSLQKHHELMKRFHGNLEKVFEAFEETLVAARKKGEIACALDEHRVSHFIGALVRGAMFEWKVSGKMGDIDTTIEQMLTFISSGIGLGGDSQEAAMTDGFLAKHTI